MENLNRREFLKKSVLGAGAAALGVSEANAQAQNKDLEFEGAEIQRITNELESAQKAHNKELQQKLLKELEMHLKKAIELTK